jgi:nucleoside-diphosphate-sugar epimerase
MSAIRGETLDVHGKDTVLSFTHVEDCANGIILAATSQMAENNIYNIAYEGEPYSLLTAAKIAIACASNGSIKILDPELGYPKTKRLAIARASFDLRFEPVIDLKTGLYRYYDWLTEQAE